MPIYTQEEIAKIKGRWFAAGTAFGSFSTAVGLSLLLTKFPNNNLGYEAPEGIPLRSVEHVPEHDARKTREGELEEPSDLRMPLDKRSNASRVVRERTDSQGLRQR